MSEYISYATKKINGALETGRLPHKIIAVEVEAGSGEFTKGTIMAQKTSNGKIIEYKKSGSDGEDKPRFILAADTLDLAHDKYTSVYDMGDFNINHVKFPSDFEDADKQKAKIELVPHKIYLSEVEEIDPNELNKRLF